MPVGKEPAGGLDLALERRRVIALESRDRRPVERLDYLDHACTPFAVAATACASRPRARGVLRTSTFILARRERLVRIGTRSKPEFGGMIGEGLRAPCEQLVIACRGEPAPVPGFAGIADVPENARELRGVIGIVRGHRQRVQTGNGGIDFTEFRFDLGEMALRRRVGRHTTQRGFE